MRLLCYIIKGQAVILNDSLRCAAPREKDSKKTCNKLLCKSNSVHQIAGDFKCQRCGQQIVVELKPPRELGQK